MRCLKKNLHESCRMGRRIDADSLICSLGYCECDGHTVHNLSQRRLTADWLARVTVHGCAIMSLLSDCQVTSRPRQQYSRYSKWLHTFRTGLVHRLETRSTNVKKILNGLFKHVRRYFKKFPHFFVCSVLVSVRLLRVGSVVHHILVVWPWLWLVPILSVWVAIER